MRQFINFTQCSEKTAMNCLSQHDWKLDVGVDMFFQCPDRYMKEPKATVDKKRIEQLFNRYRGI